MGSKRLTVGFTGHRHLNHSDLIRGSIHEVLSKLKDSAEVEAREVRLCTSIAMGGDTLAVESARALGIPVHLILPKPVEFDSASGSISRELGFAADFWERHADGSKSFREEDWNRAWKQIQDAQLGVDGCTLRLISPMKPSPECYYDAGVMMLHECDALIAVWNGRPPAALGGTSHMLQCFQTLMPTKPLIVIDAITGLRS